MIAGGIEERSLGAKQADHKKHNISTFFESIPTLFQEALLFSCTLTLHDSIPLQSSSLSPTEFDWKRDSGWEEFEPIGSLDLLYLMCLQDKLWQQYVYFIQKWVKMYVVLCVLGILTMLMLWPCRIFWTTILKC